MPGTARFEQIGQVLKSNGTDGQVIIGLRGLCAEDISEKEPVFIYFDGLPVPFFIERLTPRGNDKAIVHLNDVKDLKDAEEITGQAVFADYLEEEDDEDGFEALTGWTVAGVGKVTGFLDFPANPCLEVMTDKGEVIIPLHEDLIKSMDQKRRVISMDIPEGLLDL